MMVKGSLFINKSNYSDFILLFFLSFKNVVINTKGVLKEKRRIHIQYPNYDHFVLSFSGF